jgi:mutator protein MutT
MDMTQDIRHVARVLVINDKGETYLLRGRDQTLPDRAPFWFTPGGKIDAGESTAQAAARELHEEVGIVATPTALGEIIGTETNAYHFHGQAYQQHGVFYAYRANEAGLNTAGWTTVEAATIDQGKWWSVAALEATTETIYPAHLATMLRRYLAQEAIT